MKLVDNWKQSYRWYSVHAQWIQTAAISSWLSLPGEWRASFPSKYMVWMAIVLGLSGILGRLIDQSKQP